MNRIAIASLIALLPSGLWCQIAVQPKFEVASIKASKSGIRGGSIEFSPGGERFTMTNTPLGALLLVAYDITVRQISGAPDAISEKYDIAAKAEHPVSRDEMLLMIQALLADRFKLVVRRERKEVPVYALTIAPGGPRLRHSAATEAEQTMPRIPARAGGAESSGQYLFTNESMADFAWALTRMAGIGDRVVVDNTGLNGDYDFTLTFVRDTAPPAEAIEPAAIPDGPPISVALREQLGLKLESKRALIAFLVIAHVERPSENMTTSTAFTVRVAQGTFEAT
jgi:uncharacterized protein (TIGR03435 family)